jgi:hypothetical protein
VFFQDFRGILLKMAAFAKMVADAIGDAGRILPGDRQEWGDQDFRSNSRSDDASLNQKVRRTFSKARVLQRLLGLLFFDLRKLHLDRD